MAAGRVIGRFVRAVGAVQRRRVRPPPPDGVAGVDQRVLGVVAGKENGGSPLGEVIPHAPGAVAAAAPMDADVPKAATPAETADLQRGPDRRLKGELGQRLAAGGHGPAEAVFIQPRQRPGVVGVGMGEEYRVQPPDLLRRVVLLHAAVIEDGDLISIGTVPLRFQCADAISSKTKRQIRSSAGENTAYAVLVDVKSRKPVYLKRNDVLIGRGEQCDIRILSDTVSSEHARIYKTTKGWALCDLDSHNGTKLNGRYINQAQLIFDEDTVTFGDRVFVFYEK